jgi:SAM-dependent methyltransferase
LQEDHTPQPPARRAIVCFVEDQGPLVQQALALHRSWQHVESPDTDLVVMGPSDVLERLPDDIVKIVQRAVANDPEWGGYRYANALTHLNGVAANALDHYSYILHTEAGTFITPAWNTFYPTGFVCGHSEYVHDDDVRHTLGAIAADFGLVHRGLTNVGVSWYGPTALVRRVSALAEMLAQYILRRYFATDPGVWPGWYRGVTHKYAGELAINHCVPEAQKTEWLDASSALRASTRVYPHIHYGHTDEKFSKHWFMGGRYTDADAQHLDLDVIADYCMGMAFRALDDPLLTGPPEAVGTVQLSDIAVVQHAPVVLATGASALPLDEIHTFHQRERDRWVAAKAATVPAGMKVLEVSAETGLYRQCFAHCDYTTHDFTQYSNIDLVSGVNNRLTPSNTFDVVLCTEVLTHVPEPLDAVREMARLVKPGGRLFITAPFGASVHQLPEQFYGGYTPAWYTFVAEQHSLAVREITRIGLEEKQCMNQSTVGYHVEFVKTDVHEDALLFERLREAPVDTGVLTALAAHALARSHKAKARRLLIAALALEPENQQANQLWSDGNF